MRQLIVNADDFGLAVPVNEAVERAHRDGILTSASLMVGGAAAADAVRRARDMPRLEVGLHVVVVQGRPVLSPGEVEALVDGNGEFPRDLVRAGFRYFFLPRAREQLEREVRAQFEAFRQTGLVLDHVNAHNHMHLHPTLLSVILRVGREYGLRAMRIPDEPARAGGGLPMLAERAVMLPWLRALRFRLRRCSIRSNDSVRGLRDTGAMDVERVLGLLEHIPEGLTEMYFHPATRRSEALDRAMPRYGHEAELRALTDPRVRRAVEAAGIRLTTFSEAF